MNNSMLELHQVLAGTMAGLSRKMDTVEGAAQAQAVVREMQEVNHRLMLAGQFLFSQETAALAAGVKKVREVQAPRNLAGRSVRNCATQAPSIRTPGPEQPAKWPPWTALPYTPPPAGGKNATIWAATKRPPATVWWYPLRRHPPNSPYTTWWPTAYRCRSAPAADHLPWRTKCAPCPSP